MMSIRERKKRKEGETHFLVQLGEPFVPSCVHACRTRGTHTARGGSNVKLLLSCLRLVVHELLAFDRSTYARPLLPVFVCDRVIHNRGRDRRRWRSLNFPSSALSLFHRNDSKVGAIVSLFAFSSFEDHVCVWEEEAEKLFCR